MNKVQTVFVKSVVFLKLLFMIFILLSVIMVGCEQYNTQGQIEGRELIESTAQEFIFLMATLFATATTLFFDIKVLKQKSNSIYRDWLSLIIIATIALLIATLFKIQWLGITIMLVIGFYALYLLSKYQKA